MAPAWGGRSEATRRNAMSARPPMGGRGFGELACGRKLERGRGGELGASGPPPPH
jgi:hypothetical protein